MRLLRRALRKTFIGLVLVLIPTLWGLNYWTDSIFSPERRQIFKYHQERLAAPERFALKIQPYGCVQGKVPCLLVETDPRYISSTGKKVRQQVQASGQTLPRYGKSYATLVLLHGRRGRKEDLLPIAERFVALGFRCLLLDLPAHGESPLTETSFGASSFERSLPRLALEDAIEHFKIPANQPAALWGMSMGGAFAVAAASEAPQRWQSLIVVSSFDRMERIMLEHMPPRWQFVGILARAAVDEIRTVRGKTLVSHVTPAEWATHIQTPTLIVHGDQDPLIKQRQGKTLFEAVQAPEKSWINVQGGGHNSVLTTPMPLYAEMGKWLLQHI